MSRIGKLPITIPDTVTVNYSDSQIIVKGKFGTLETNIPETIGIQQDNSLLTVSLKNEGSKIIYSAENAYGYKLNGRQWRFTKKHTYEVVATEGLWVYRLQNSNEWSSYSYFYSDGAYGEVKPLTRHNIKKCFSSNPQLIAVIEKLDWRLDLFQPTNFKKLPLISALFVQVFSKNGYPL